MSAVHIDVQYVQVAPIKIDPAHLKSYRAAVTKQIDATIRGEPGVLVLYAVSEEDNSAHVTVFEIYEDMAAYKAHLESAHFKKYKVATETMVKSLTLIRSTPIMLGTKGQMTATRALDGLRRQDSCSKPRGIRRWDVR